MANGQYGNIGRGYRGGYGDYYGYGRQNPYARGYHSGIRPQFVDYGKVISNRIAPGIQRLYFERKAKEEQHIKNIDNMAVGPDYLKVQSEWQPGVEQQVALEHTAYLEGARLMKKHRVGSKEYMQGQQMLKGAQTNLQNLDKIFTLHQTHRKTFDENLKAGKYSGGNLNAAQSKWFETMTTPWENMSFEGGRIVYKGMGENGEDIDFNDLENPFLKADGLMSNVLKQLDDNIKLAKQGKGKVLNAETGEMEWNTQLSDYYLGNLFSNASTQDMISVAYDLKFENPDPNITEQLSFSTAYGIGNGQTITDDIKNSEKYQIQKDYKEGKLGGNPTKYETWAKDPELRDMLHNELTKFFTDSFKGAAEQQYVEPVVNPGDISDREKHIDKMMLDALKAGYRYDPTTRTYTKIEGGGGGSDATDPETLNTLVDNLEKDLDIGKFMSSVNNENLRVMPAKSPHAAYLKDNWFWVGDEQLPYSKVRDKAAAAKMSVNDYIIANKLEPIDEFGQYMGEDGTLKLTPGQSYVVQKYTGDDDEPWQDLGEIPYNPKDGKTGFFNSLKQQLSKAELNPDVLPEGTDVILQDLYTQLNKSFGMSPGDFKTFIQGLIDKNKKK